MADLTTSTLAVEPLAVGSSKARGAGGAGWRRAVLWSMGLYFLLPIAAALEFALRGPNGTHTLAAFRDIFAQPDLVPMLLLSLKIAAGTVVLTLLLMVPTVVWLHLRLPRLRRLIEGLSLLPLVVPAVVLVVGVLTAFANAPNAVKGTPVILSLEYVVLAMPFSFRALDAGVGAVHLPTLVEAARTLGAGWGTVLLRVVVPNIRTAIVGTALLTTALVLGEFTMASLMLFDTFPTWIVRVGQEQAGVAVGLSVLVLLVSWGLLLLLSVAAGRSRRAARPRENT